MPALAVPRPSSSSRPSSAIAAEKSSFGSNSSGSDLSTYLSAESGFIHRRSNSTQQRLLRTEPPPVQKITGQNGFKGRDMGREKPPSKDGAAQRAAGEVAGLKDFVCQLFF